MLFVSLVFLFLRVLFLVLRILFYYFSIFLVKLFYFFVSLPLLLFYLLRLVLNLVFMFFFSLLRFFYLELLFWVRGLWAFFVMGGFIQFLNHLRALLITINRALKWFKFYIKFYRLFGNSFTIAKLFQLVEKHSSLLITKSVSLPTEKVLLWWSYFRITDWGRGFRMTRRIIKFIIGTITLFYPILALSKFFFWYLSKYLFSLLEYLEEESILVNKNKIRLFLKFIVYIKLFLVWSILPFELVFKPGFNKKYWQYEDMEPDLHVIKAEVWDFSSSRGCLFDDDTVLNKYYLFHRVRWLSKVIFNVIALSLTLGLLGLVHIGQFFATVYFIIYIFFSFFYYSVFFVFLSSIFKLSIVLLNLIPIFPLLFLFFGFYYIYRFWALKFKYFFSQTLLNSLSFQFYIYIRLVDFHRLNLFLYYLIFRIKAFNYFIFNNFRGIISLSGLVRVSGNLLTLTKSLSKPLTSYASLISYNSSFIFKRFRSYTLRFKNIQFISNFLKSRSTSRLTPDQIKAFRKIALNSHYPVYYFERLFDLEYSKLEQEYEIPYYWAFVKQTFSSRQNILHPKFHLYGFLGFLNFFWNYFSFLNNNSLLNFKSIEFHEFIQLFNSSLSHMFSYLMNDFFILSHLRRFYYYWGLNNMYLRITTFTIDQLWYLLPTELYKKLITFHWYYFEPPLLKIIFYYYSISNPYACTPLYSMFEEYVESARHIIGWLVFSFFERWMNKIFMSTDKFEHFYDMNFDISREKYGFYFLQFKKFITKKRFHIKGSKRRNSTKLNYKSLPKYLTKSIRYLEFRKNLTKKGQKDYVNNTSLFFSGSFIFFGYFYVFVRDNVFEVVAYIRRMWDNYKASTIVSWAKRGKYSLLIWFFIKFFVIIWVYIMLGLMFSFLYLARSIIIKILNKIKKTYVKKN